jgi:hypothetical protein
MLLHPLADLVVIGRCSSFRSHNPACTPDVHGLIPERDTAGTSGEARTTPAGSLALLADAGYMPTDASSPVVASVGMSRWWLVAGGSIFALAAVNTLIDRRRTCACLSDCWCKTTLGRNFRWVAPMRHHLPENNYYA